MLLAGMAGLFLLPTPWNVVAVCVAALIEVAEVAFWLRFLRRYRVRTGAEGMVGERAEVIEPVGAGGGRVRVYGEIWAARSAGAPLGGRREGARDRRGRADGLDRRRPRRRGAIDHGKGPLKRGPVSERTCRRRSLSPARRSFKSHEPYRRLSLDDLNTRIRRNVSLLLCPPVHMRGNLRNRSSFSSHSC